MDLLLYHFPGSCSRVALECLEQAGTGFAERTVALLAGAQREPAYLALNPKGKVPVLVADGVVITETPAIVTFLAAAFPTADLLPADRGPAGNLIGLSDLIWCSSALHPAAHRVFRPNAYTQGDADGVRAAALAQLVGYAALIASRLEPGPWWFGERWSAVDAYLGWIFRVSDRFGFPLADYPAIVAHCARGAARPAFMRALAKEDAAVARDALEMVPGTR